MPTIDELRKTRVEKLKKLEAAGILVYPAKTNRTNSIAEVLEEKEFKKLSKSKKRIVLVGRIMAMRGHGGATFLDINDGSASLTTGGSGKIQVIIKQDKIGEKGYKFFLDVFDIGDFVEIKGILFTTQRGEKTIEAEDYKMLSKSLLPLPEKWHGIQDVEERLRKRYLDIIFNPEVKEMIKKRTMFWASMREFLVEKGFLEVETPVLETTPGGADARPFITHHNALDMDVYLRISMGELWQKRLMVAGFEKTFEIGRQFRNEGMDSEHLQDYTQMEFYWAYADYEQGMELVEEMYKYVAEKTFGTLKFKIRGFDVDLGKKWEKYDYQSTIAKYTGVNIEEASLLEIEKVLQKLKIDYDKKGFNITRAIDNLWKHCRKNISGPGFLINVPIVMEPLAKKMEKNPKLVQRFQVILAGSENGKGYSELNDPIDQAERFTEQQKLRDAGDQEAQMYDKDFVEALEHGMPPTCGFGVSERLFSFLMDKPSRDCQIFPLMKPENPKAVTNKKQKEKDVAVVIVNKSAGLEPWQEMNTVAHLSASFAARHGTSLFTQSIIKTKDNKEIKLNIKDAIMIKETNDKADMMNLISVAKEKGLEVVEFTKEMIETTDDKKIIEKTANIRWEDINYLGILVFGKKSVVTELTDKFKLWEK